MIHGWLVELPLWDLGFLVVATYRQRAAHFSTSEKPGIKQKHEQQFKDEEGLSQTGQSHWVGDTLRSCSVFCRDKGRGSPRRTSRWKGCFPESAFQKLSLCLQPFWNASQQRCGLLITIGHHVCPPTALRAGSSGDPGLTRAHLCSAAHSLTVTVSQASPGLGKAAFPHRVYHSRALKFHDNPSRHGKP